MAIETQSPECTWKWGSHVEIRYFLRLLISISYTSVYFFYICRLSFSDHHKIVLWLANTLSIYSTLHLYGGSWWLSGKESICQCKRCGRCGFDPWVRKVPWRRKWQPTPEFLLKKKKKIPWTVEPGGQHTVGLQRVGHDWMTEQAHRLHNS